MNLAHGVGRVYELPVPLHYYLAGSAIAVAGSLIVSTVTLRAASPRAGSRILLGAGATGLLAKVLRIVTFVGIVYALISAVVGFDSTFGFAAI